MTIRRSHEAPRHETEIVELPELVMHVDWTSMGAMRTTIIGRATGPCADDVVRRLDAFVARGLTVVLFKDHWNTTSYDPTYLARIATWVEEHRAAMTRMHVVSKSILAGMVYGAASSRYGTLLQRHTSRLEFDREAAIAGFPDPVELELAASVVSPS